MASAAPAHTGLAAVEHLPDHVVAGGDGLGLEHRRRPRAGHLGDAADVQLQRQLEHHVEPVGIVRDEADAAMGVLTTRDLHSRAVVGPGEVDLAGPDRHDVAARVLDSAGTGVAGDRPRLIGGDLLAIGTPGVADRDRPVPGGHVERLDPLRQPHLDLIRLGPPRREAAVGEIVEEGARVVVLEDLGRRRPLESHAIRAVLRHPDAVTPSAPFEDP
jgi:hypothetical protein